MTLNRFKYAAGGLVKLMTSVDIPASINFAGTGYTLEAAVIHAGRSANCGHYYAVRQFNDQVKVYNDSHVSSFKSNTNYIHELQDKFSNDTPYILLYSQV